MDAKDVEIIRAVAKARENVKAEMKRNGKGEMTLGISAAESIERATSRAYANIRGV